MSTARVLSWALDAQGAGSDTGLGNPVKPDLLLLRSLLQLTDGRGGHLAWTPSHCCERFKIVWVEPGKPDEDVFVFVAHTPGTLGPCIQSIAQAIDQESTRFAWIAAVVASTV